MKIGEKRYYKKIIETALIQKGLITKPIINKEYIIEIVNDIFYDYIKKQENINKENTNLITVEEEKCSAPDYIQNLPGDLRTNDPNILNERINEIDNRINKYNKELEDLNQNINRRQKIIDGLHNEITQEHKQIRKYIEYNEIIENAHNDLVKRETEDLNYILDKFRDVFGDEAKKILTYDKRNSFEYSDEILDAKIMAESGLLSSETIAERFLPLWEGIYKYFNENPNSKIDRNAGEKIAESLINFTHDYYIDNHKFTEEFITNEKGIFKPNIGLKLEKGTWAYNTKRISNLVTDSAENTRRLQSFEATQYTDNKKKEEITTIVNDLVNEKQRTIQHL